MMEESPPKRRFQRAQLRMTVPLAEGWSSSGVKERPMRGWTPSVANRSQEQIVARTFSGSVPPSDRLYCGQSLYSARLENDLLWRFHSAKMPGAGPFAGKRSLVS